MAICCTAWCTLYVNRRFFQGLGTHTTRHSTLHTHTRTMGYVSSGPRTRKLCLMISSPSIGISSTLKTIELDQPRKPLGIVEFGHGLAIVDAPDSLETFLLDDMYAWNIPHTHLIRFGAVKRLTGQPKSSALMQRKKKRLLTSLMTMTVWILNKKKTKLDRFGVWISSTMQCVRPARRRTDMIECDRSKCCDTCSD